MLLSVLKFSIFILISAQYIYSQISFDPQFSSFNGKVYRIPIDSVKKGFEPYLFENDPYCEITWPELNFPSRPNTELFPGIDLTQAFGIMFTATVTIPIDGLYLFGLKSDDGSLLWIDDQIF